MESKDCTLSLTRKPLNYVGTMLNTASLLAFLLVTLPIPNTEGFGHLASPIWAIIHLSSSQLGYTVESLGELPRHPSAQALPPESWIQLVWDGALASVVLKTPRVLLKHSQGNRPLI